MLSDFNQTTLKEFISQLCNKIEYRYIVVIIYTCVLFLDRLDLTIVNITLPTLADYFRVPITQTEWITNSFLLALAISIPISGWLGDRFGVKKIFILATALFGLSSLLCAFSPNLISMVILRFFQGFGGGIIIPVGMTMVYRVFDHSEYASITSFIFLPTLIAPAIAPLLGGIIIHFTTWKWVFLFVVPICFFAVILSVFFLREQKIEDTSPLDWGGFLLSSVTLTSMLYFISALGKYGLTLYTSSFLSFSLIFGYWFIKHERKTLTPLIDISFFKNNLFLQANLIQFAFQICHFGSIFLVGMYLQIGVGMSAMISGLIMGMQALGAMCTSRYSVYMFYNSGPSKPIIIGFIGVALFTMCILLVDKPNMILTGVIILFCRGIFSGLCGTPIQTASVIGFAKKDVGRANAIFNAGRQISISFGVALSSLLIAYGFKAHGTNIAHTDQVVMLNVFYYAFAMIPFISLMGIIFTLFVNDREVLLINSRK